MKIFLIGPGGVGKTTCGAILANSLGYNFIDLDTEFASELKMLPPISIVMVMKNIVLKIQDYFTIS